MASLLPRGVSSAGEPKKPHGDLPSPSEDLNVTVTKLLDTKAQLLDKIAELEGDKKHFQSKLEEYIRYDREEGGSGGEHDRATISQLEKQITELVAEKADLQVRLLKSKDSGDLCTSPHDLSERGHRAHLLQRLNDLQANSVLTQQKHTREVEALKLENSRLREEASRLKRSLNMADWQESGKGRRPSWEIVHPHPHLHSTTTEGHSSLPESLPSYSSQGSVTEHYKHTTESISTRPHYKEADIPNIAALKLTSNPSPAPDSTSAELKKIKKQLDRYKTVNIELDQKLKDAKLELRKYEERRSDADVGYRMDMERFRSENNQLRIQLDRALSECHHLKSLVSRRY